MPTVDEIERDDEELADYDVGFRDRLDCEPWEASPGEDLVLSKGRTEEQRWSRLKALHGMQAQTRPRLGVRVGCWSRTQSLAAVSGLDLDSHLLLKLLSHCTDNNAEGVGITLAIP